MNAITPSIYRRNNTPISELGAKIFFRELSGGDEDTIHDCPHDIHEFSAHKPTYDLTVDLDENQKEILYYRAIRYWSPQRLAAYRNQTDRNIRKVYTKMIDDMRYELF